MVGPDYFRIADYTAKIMTSELPTLFHTTSSALGRDGGDDEPQWCSRRPCCPAVSVLATLARVSEERGCRELIFPAESRLRARAQRRR